MPTLPWTETIPRVPVAEFFSTLPPEYSQDLFPEIQTRVRESNRVVVVLDDDPTGTQTVHDVDVLTAWSVGLLRDALQEAATCLYILTNSRSVRVERARAINREIAQNVQEAAHALGREFIVVSRSDSTLRGHYPGEILALGEVLKNNAHLIVPCFVEGGRFTLDSIHWVREGEYLVPAAQTEFAWDKDFGYRNSNLREWVAEKSAGRWANDAVGAIRLQELRGGGPEAVAHSLRSVHGPVVVDAATYRDIEVLVAGLLRLGVDEQRFLYRTAASFVRVRAGISAHPLLSRAELVPQETRNGGLIVVGSYISKTTRQLERLLELGHIEPLELVVEKILDSAVREREIQRVLERAEGIIAGGRDALIYTSRQLALAESESSLLDVGKQVSRALVTLVSRLQARPSYIIAKGGITSSDLATQGLEVRRATVLGQVKPGIPVWRLGGESRFAGMTFIVFPGNVGDDTTLAQLVLELRGDSRAGL